MSRPTQHDLFPETLLVTRQGARVFTTSLKVAEHFGKQHKNVLRAIDMLRTDLAEEGFSRLNFEPANVLVDIHFEAAEYLDEQKKPRLLYHLSHDGFALLAMGFTGRAALARKAARNCTFHAMEAELAAQAQREAGALYRLRPRWQCIAAHPELSRVALTALTGHRSPQSITACRRRMRQVGLLVN